MSLSSADVVSLLHILAPQLSYTKRGRDDGFTNRFERGLAIYQRGNVERIAERPDGSAQYRVPSYRIPSAAYFVWLDAEDGDHQCTCQDRRFCCHRFAAALAELEHRTGTELFPRRRRRALTVDDEYALYGRP